jgi:hypothetical protein
VDLFTIRPSCSGYMERSHPDQPDTVVVECGESGRRACSHSAARQPI